MWVYYFVLMKYDLNKVIFTSEEQEYVVTLLELNECNPLAYHLLTKYYETDVWMEGYEVEYYFGSKYEKEIDEMISKTNEDT